MYRLLPPVDSAIEGEGGGGGKGGRTREGGRRVKSSERWEVEGKQRRGRSENWGVCVSIWFPLCICMFVFVGEEERAGKEGRKGRGDQLVCKP